LSTLTSPPTLDEKKRRLLALLLAEEGIDPLRSPLLALPRVAGGEEGKENAFPLSFSQERLWLIDRLEPGSAAYNLPTALRLAGRLDLDALARTLAEIVRRHEVLRTTYEERDGRPVQVVHPAAPIPLPRIDLGGLAAARRNAGDTEARRLATAEAARPFDLARGPVLRVQLMRLGALEHALSFTVHHIASDGWSSGVLVAELSALYAAFSRGLPSPLPALPIQYADFAAWQRQVLQGPALERSLAYWRRQLAAPPPPLALPADRPRPAAPSPAGGSVPVDLPAAATAALRGLGQRSGATLLMTVTAAYAALLVRLTGETDFAIGTPVAGRARREVEPLIGFFVNTLVLRVDLAGDLTFGDILERVRQVMLAAFAHQDLPFDQLVQELQPERSLGETPFFQTMCALFTPGEGELALPGLTLHAQPIESAATLFDLTLSLADAGDEVGGGLEYRSDLFDRTTVERFAGHFLSLVRAAADDPGRRLSELPILSAPEAQALREWNDTAASYSLELCLNQGIAAQGARTPEAVAVELEGKSLSYGELATRAGEWAARLRALGVGPEGRVGIALERSPELIVALLAVLAAGAAYVPLDPSYPAERLRFMLADSGVGVVVTQARVVAALPAMSSDIRVLFLEEGEVVPPLGAPLLASPLTQPPPAQGGGTRPPKKNVAVEGRRVGPDDLAYVLYTSGSTGVPKGAMNSHRAIVNRLLWMQERYGLRPEDHVLQKTPVSFDVSVWELFWPLLTGARLVLARPGGHQDPFYLARTIALREITTVHFVPSMLQAFLAEPEVERCRSLVRVIASGEALPAPLAERFFDLLPEAGLHNLYGPTEAAVDVTAWECAPGSRRPSVPIGRPIANTQIHLLDRALVPVPVGVTGELWIGGVQPARGYLGRPGLTAERFLPDPFPVSSGALGTRLYRTGDLARWRTGGEIEYLGRTDSQVKVRGVRIELGEVEAALRRHPGVAAAAVGLTEKGDLLAWLVPAAGPAGPLLRLLRLRRQGLPAGATLLDLPDGTPVVQRNRGETEFLYGEIFTGRGYLRHGITIGPGDRVFDVGANIGLFTLFAGREAPGVTVYAFEPIPQVFAALAANAALHGVEARLFEHALGEAPGEAELTYYPHATLLSGRHADGEDREVVRSFLARDRAGISRISSAEADELLALRLQGEPVVCRVRTLSAVIREEGVARIDLLKVDAEKSELEVLSGLDEGDWGKVRQVVAEVHDLGGRLARVVSLLRDHGFAVAIEQDEALGGTSLWNVFARRPESASLPEPAAVAAAIIAAVAEVAPEPAWTRGEDLLRDVRRDLALTLPEAMIPSSFLLLDALPLTPSGKLDRRALPRTAPGGTERQAGADGAHGANRYAAPRTPVEELVAAAWAEVLGVPRVGVSDNFFDLGGHSLLATQVLSRLREALHVELPLRELFAAPTVAGLAAAVEKARAAGEILGGAPALTRSRRTHAPRLSFAQERLWFLDRLAPGSVAYNVPAAVRLRGRLDPAALAATLREIVRRHEVLRTSFETTATGPIQVIAPRLDLPLPLTDLSRLPRAAREAEALRVAGAAAGRPFDLSRGPLLRTALLRLGSEEHALLVTLHHIATDAWSLGVLLAEIAALYPAALSRRPSPLPELAVQYADYALWQRSWLSGAVLDAQVVWWKERLAGFPDRLELPADRPRPAVQSFRGGSLSRPLAAALGGALRALSRKSGTTLFMSLLAAFAATLSRFTGQPALLVGSTIAHRTRRELEGLIGFFVNTLALPADLRDDPPFATALARARETALAAYAHQDLPFERLVEALVPRRDPAHPPLVQVVLQMQNAPLPDLALPGLAWEPFAGGTETAKFDLVVSAMATATDGGKEEIFGEWLYCADLFDAPTIGRLAAGFETLLGAAMADPGRAVSDLPLLGPGERQQLVIEWVEWNAGPGIAAPLSPTLHAAFFARAAATPDAVAVVHAGELLSYGALSVRAGRLARRLQGLGIGPESRVGICLERSLELVTAVVGVLAAGGAYVPLDPAYPRERLAYLLADSGVAALVTAGWLLSALPETSAPLVLLDEREIPDPDEGSGERSDADSDNLAYVIYTSGSTGQPKGVAVTHGNVSRLFMATEPDFGCGPGDTWTLFHSYAFDFSVWEIWGALLQGGRLVVVPPEVSRSPVDFVRLLARERVTVLSQTPSAFRQLLWAEAAAGAEADLAGLRRVVLGGEALDVPGLSPWIARHGDERPALVNMYGITETTVHVTSRRIRRADLTADRMASPIGFPLPHLTLHLLDGGLRPVPVGVPGEIFVGGAGVARGYLGRPERTAERFLPDPLGGPGTRLYRSGDLARRRADGQLEYLGRADDQVKIRGFRIEPGEVQAAVAALPAVREAVVLARPGMAVGEETRLVAYVVAAGDLTLSELRGALAGRLPEPLLPSALVLLPALPLTAHGKIDRKKLLEMETAAGSTPAVESESEAPRTALERVLAGLFREVLKVERVGRSDNFFELGGNSIAGAVLINRLQQELGEVVPVVMIFDAPTVRDLAARLGEARPQANANDREERGDIPARSWAPGEPIPLSFAQERLWFLDQLTPGAAHYNLPSALRLQGALNVEGVAALDDGLAALVHRHAALRTTFGAAEGRVFQVVAPAGTRRPDLPWVDLAGLPSGPAEAEGRRLADAFARRPFDLARGPLLRAALLRLGKEEHLALFTMHHIVSDGWSMGVLIHELTHLYAAGGNAAALPALPIQYPDYALWQRERLAGAPLAAQTAYWVDALAGAETLEMPTDLPRPPVPSADGGAAWRFLPAPLGAALSGLAERQGATLFMAVLAAWSALLSRYSGQDDVSIGTPVANRTRREVEGLIGFFVNTLVLRLDLRPGKSGEPGFAALVERARRTALAAFAHQDVPFEKVVEAIQPPRERGRSPLFQVMLAFQNTPEAELDLPGLTVEPVEVETGSAKFDLTLSVQESPQGLLLRAGYRTDLFFPPTIERLLDHTAALLAAAVAEPRRPVRDLPLLHAAERHQLLAEWNDTAPDGLPETTLHGLFAAAARDRADAAAVLSGRTVLTYGELDRRSARLADHLRSRGVGPEVRVGLQLPRSPELIVAILAVLRAGGAYLPLDPSHPQERIDFQLADAGAALVLTQEDRLGGPEELVQVGGPGSVVPHPPTPLSRPALPSPGRGGRRRSPHVGGEGGLQIGGESGFLASSGASLPSPGGRAGGPGEGPGVRAGPWGPAVPDALAYIIYTSGSTGTPNGVLVPHRGAVHLIRQAAALYGVTPESRVLQIASPGFDASVLEIFLALAHGASLFLAADEERLMPAVLAGRLRDAGVTTAVLTPAFLSVLPEERLGGLRSLSVGGEACPAELAARWAPGRTLLNCYGPTEATIFATVSVLRGEGTIPIGRPVAGVRAEVVDRALEPLPIGVAGELVLGGLGLARGYASRPEKTAERFVPDPRAAGDRLYRTGDLARLLATGEIEILGRIDDQVKVRGFRIEPGEIESALLRHPAVRAAAVVARGAASERHLVAYVAVPAGEAGEPASAAPTPAELRRFLAATLPEPLVPAVIVVLPALPQTASGKVDRRALPAPETVQGGGSVLPRTALERFLAGLWQEVLGREEIGVEDDFFALGGTSLQAAILVNLLEKRFGEYVYVVALFDAPTIASLASYLEQHYPAAAARVTGRAEPQGALLSTGSARVDAEDVRRFRALLPSLPPRRSRRSLRPAPLRRAVFVLSPPRSGSTLLRALLAGHPALFAPPELELLGFDTLGERARALAGRWALWREGTIRALMEAEALPFEEAKAEMAALEAADFPVHALYSRLASATAATAATAAMPPRTLVDKTPSYALDPAILARAEEDFAAPLYIHLLRHPRAMIASFTKARLDQVFFRPPHDLDPGRLAELIWLVSQENIRDFLATVPAERSIQLRFEDLVRDPRREMERLAAFLGVGFHPGLLDPYDDPARRMTDGAHALSKMVGDVKFHEHRKVDPEVADAWRREAGEDPLGEPTWRLAESLGYARPSAPPAFSPLVPLRTSGPGRPLFCVHPVGGNVLCYAELARRLDRPVYGLQSLGLGGGEPQESVEAMAVTYTAAVTAAQPEGPLALAGWSIGGVIAWEMARQLARTGRQVESVILLDTLAPGAHPEAAQTPSVAEVAEADLLAAIAADLGGIAGREVDVDGPQTHRLLRVYRANVEAVQRYRPAPDPSTLSAPSRVVLLRAAERPGGRVVDPALGWEALAPGLLVRELAGDHYSLLRAPQVESLAATIEELLSAEKPSA
jgi:amino acid adenylation domain-containing protein/FkbM family methyltransferase